MISEQKAIKLIRDNIPINKTEIMDLLDSSGYVLAEDVSAPSYSPTFTNSAMDGYAVKWMDINSQVNKYKIVGESQAGKPFVGKIEDGCAIRINTGAMVPEDVDTVIPIENCTAGDLLTINCVKRKGQHVRYKGEEFKPGDILLNKGTVIDSQQLGLLSSVGIAKIEVFSPPSVAIIVTGTELVGFDTEVKPHQLRDSNTPMLYSALEKIGVKSINSYRVEDSLEDTRSTLEHAAKLNDIIIFSGGVSVGSHDHVKNASKAVGFSEIFWKIKQKPGKPFYFARKNNLLLFGLPGNPVSAFMCFVHYIKPVIKQLQSKYTNCDKIKGNLNTHLENKSDRTQFLRVKINLLQNDSIEIEVPSYQGSHMLTSVAKTNGYIRLKSGQSISKNEIIEAYLF